MADSLAELQAQYQEFLQGEVRGEIAIEVFGCEEKLCGKSKDVKARVSLARWMTMRTWILSR